MADNACEAKDYVKYAKFFTNEEIYNGIIRCVDSFYKCDGCPIYGLCERLGSIGMLYVLAKRLKLSDGMLALNANDPKEKNANAKC